MKIVLIGYMGSGKSQVGKYLSEILGIPFFDLDEVIEATVGMSLPDIFDKKGELFFRKKEADVLESLLESTDDFVLATGGGTPCYGNTMALINAAENCRSIYLKANVPTLTRRLITEKDQRPLIAHLKDKDALNEFVRKHLFERNHYYLQANQKVDANVEVSAVAEQIVLSLF